MAADGVAALGAASPASWALWALSPLPVAGMRPDSKTQSGAANVQRLPHELRSTLARPQR